MGEHKLGQNLIIAHNKEDKEGKLLTNWARSPSNFHAYLHALLYSWYKYSQYGLHLVLALGLTVTKLEAQICQELSHIEFLRFVLSIFDKRGIFMSDYHILGPWRVWLICTNTKNSLLVANFFSKIYLFINYRRSSQVVIKSI